MYIGYLSNYFHYSISLINVLFFSVEIFIFMVKFIPKYFIIFDAIINGIVF